MGMIMGALLGVLIGVIAYVLIEAFTGASLGKMILGLKAGTLDGKKGKRWSLYGKSCCSKVFIDFPNAYWSNYTSIYGWNEYY